MKINQYIHRIQKIDSMIRYQHTGPPAAFAEKLGVSESTLYNYINFMREAGAPVAYSKKHQTYYYLYNVRFRYGFTLSD